MVNSDGTPSQGRRTVRVLVVATVLLMLLGPVHVSAFPFWGDEAIGVTPYHQITIIQGDDPNTEAEEPRNGIFVVDRTAWSIPWNSSEIYTYIPPEARNITVDNIKSISHQGGSIFIPGDFSRAVNPGDPPTTGWMEGTENEGYYFWRFPEQVSRDLNNRLGFSTTADFEDADPGSTDLTGWNITDNMLILASNSTTATYVSKRYTGGHDLTSVNMTTQAHHGQNMTFQVSADNGTTWGPVANGIPVQLDGVGAEFRWRVTMTQNLSHNATPILFDVAFDITFTPLNTDIWIETSYFLDIVDGGTVFDQTFPFDATITSLVLAAYFDDDMDLHVNGTEVMATSGGTYVGKTAYTHMTGGHAPIITFTVTDTTTNGGEDGFISSYGIYIVVLILVLIMAIGIAMVLTADRRKKDGTVDVSSGSTEADGQDPLSDRKDQLMEAINDLDEDHRIGLIDEQEHRARREALKAEAVEVMKRQDGADED